MKELALSKDRGDCLMFLSFYKEVESNNILSLLQYMYEKIEESSQSVNNLTLSFIFSLFDVLYKNEEGRLLNIVLPIIYYYIPQSKDNINKNFIIRLNKTVIIKDKGNEKIFYKKILLNPTLDKINEDEMLYYRILYDLYTRYLMEKHEK